MPTATARRFTKEEVAELLDVSVEVIRHWTTTGVIPRAFVTRGDGREFRYAAVTVALGLLIADLGQKLGTPKSPVPFMVARQVAPRLAQAWNEPLPVRLRVEFGDGAEMVFTKLDCLRQAQDRIAAMAA